MGLRPEVRRERRRAKAAPYPRPRGPSPQGCTWDEQKGGWWKADGTEWQRKRIPEPEAPKGPTKWTIAFEEECAAREAREKAVRFDSSTVYCAKHLYTLDNEMCSTCAKRGWRDVRCARSRPQTSPTLIVTRACQVRLPQGRVFHAHALRQWRHPSSQPCLEERIVQRVCRARGPGHLQVQGHGQV
jgi:hypothetical protein